MGVEGSPREGLTGRLAPQATALVILAVQIAANATRDALFRLRLVGRGRERPADAAVLVRDATPR